MNKLEAQALASAKDAVINQNGSRFVSASITTDRENIKNPDEIDVGMSDDSDDLDSDEIIEEPLKPDFISNV